MGRMNTNEYSAENSHRFVESKPRSKRNQRIEVWWSFNRRNRVVFFKDLKERGIFFDFGGRTKFVGYTGPVQMGYVARPFFHVFFHIKTTEEALFLESIYAGQIFFSFIFMHYFLH